MRGQFSGKLALGEIQVQQEVYVVDKLLKPLLGQPAIEALGLLARIRTVEEDKSPVHQFPRLFQGLGRI